MAGWLVGVEAVLGVYTFAKTHNLPATRNGKDTRAVEGEGRAAPQARSVVEAGWFMGAGTQVAGKLAGSSESPTAAAASPQRGRGRPKSYQASYGIPSIGACPAHRVLAAGAA